MTTLNFYGTGFAFPPRVQPENGRIAQVGGTDIVAQAIRMLLRTAPGERLMRPNYGCDLRRFLFAPNTVATRRLLSDEITRSINFHEDRVSLQGVDVTQDEAEPAQVNILIRYTLRRTGAAGSVSESFRLDGNGR
jgi:hypothetical protein